MLAYPTISGIKAGSSGCSSASAAASAHQPNISISVLLALPTSQALGIQARIRAACDKKVLSRRYLQTYMPRSTCIFGEAEDFIKSKGKCYMHDQPCTMVPSTSEPLDLLSGGLCCHPFSGQRNKKGDTPNTGPVEGHCEYGLVMTDFFFVVDARSPGYLVRFLVGFCTWGFWVVWEGGICSKK